MILSIKSTLVPVLMTAAVLAVCAGCIGGETGGMQTFNTSFGKIELDIPFQVKVNDMSGSIGNRSALYLVMPNGRAVLDVFIKMPENQSSFDVLVNKQGIQGLETTKTDYNKTLYLSLAKNTQGTSDYAAYIDYLKEKDVIVTINGGSKYFTEDEFRNMSKSFKFE